MPFGLCNTPATFQMEEVLSGLAQYKCLVYLDDVLVMGRTFQEHIHILQEVLTRLFKADLKLKPSKCKLVQREIEFLRYIVSEKGISANPEKVRAVTDIKYPMICDQ